MDHYRSINAYMTGYSKETQEILEKLRVTIQKAAPEAEETISYGIPTFKLHGNLVHFGAYETHIGFYPGASGIVAFAKELAPYISGKGTVRFPIDKPIPLRLITKVVKFRVAENTEKNLKRKRNVRPKPNAKNAQRSR